MSLVSLAIMYGHLEGAGGNFALQSCDAGRRRNLLGAALGAAHVGMAGMATGVASHRAQPFDRG